MVPCEATQIVGTLVVVYGWFLPATGWPYALMVWGYALIAFVLASAIKIAVYRLLDHRYDRQSRHLKRIEGWLISHVRFHP